MKNLRTQFWALSFLAFCGTQTHAAIAPHDFEPRSMLCVALLEKPKGDSSVLELSQTTENASLKQMHRAAMIFGSDPAKSSDVEKVLRVLIDALLERGLNYGKLLNHKLHSPTTPMWELLWGEEKPIASWSGFTDRMGSNVYHGKTESRVMPFFNKTTGLIQGLSFRTVENIESFLTAGGAELYQAWGWNALEVRSPHSGLSEAESYLVRLREVFDKLPLKSVRFVRGDDNFKRLPLASLTGHPEITFGY